MIKISNDIKIHLACGATDMRKSINGLCQIVENSFKLSPYDNICFVFCNKNRNRLKILIWEQNGFWIMFKRLEQGHFKWPNNETETLILNLEELKMLINSPRVEQKLKRKQLFCDK